MAGYNRRWKSARRSTGLLATAHATTRVIENHTAAVRGEGKARESRDPREHLRDVPRSCASRVPQEYFRENWSCKEWTRFRDLLQSNHSAWKGLPADGKDHLVDGMDVIPMRDGLVLRRRRVADSVRTSTKCVEFPSQHFFGASVIGRALLTVGGRSTWSCRHSVSADARLRAACRRNVGPPAGDESVSPPCVRRFKIRDLSRSRGTWAQCRLERTNVLLCWQSPVRSSDALRSPSA